MEIKLPKKTSYPIIATQKEKHIINLLLIFALTV